MPIDDVGDALREQVGLVGGRLPVDGDGRDDRTERDEFRRRAVARGHWERYDERS